MIEQMFTQLPTVSNSTMDDIICAVQGYVSPSTLGLSTQQTLSQVFALFKSNLVLFNSGNPNGAVAGETYQLCWDSVNNILWVCTTSGTSSTAVWTKSIQLTAGSGIIITQSGDNIEIASSAAGLFLPLAGGTMSGDIDMDGNLIHNLDTPVSAGDATNKDYVDTLIGSSAGGNSGAMQYNNAGAFGGDDNFTTDGSGNVDITGSLDVDNLSLNGNRLSASTGLVELEDAQLFNDMDADSNKVINLLDPTSPQDAATKAYVDAVAQGLYFLEPARVASTTNFASTYNNGASGVGATLTASASGAASIDGVSLSINDRVLFKNQTNTFENGIYTVTQVGDGSSPAIYTRATDYDEPSDIDPGDFIVILAGTTNTGTGWVETATVTTIGTDAITFVAFTNANYVTINTNQTITGQKTFSGNVALSSGATLNLNSSTAVDKVIDDDTFATATATNIPTAESVKSYVDSQVAAGGITQIVTTVFNASVTYTPTSGMKFATFYVCGGGGAGGGAASSGGTNFNVGGGGGAGYSAYGIFTAAQIASLGGSLSLTIGARGTTPGAAPGGNGGNTLIPSFVQADGGQGGGMGVTGTLGRASGGTGGVLGSGTGYSVGMLGAGGSDALFTASVAASGTGGSCGFGLGMGGKNRCIGTGSGAAHGYDAVGYGSGGGGGCAAGTANANGGLGTQGIVIITEYIA